MYILHSPSVFTLVVVVSVEVHRRDEKGQHTALQGVFRIADVDVEDGAVAVAETCGGTKRGEEGQR